METPSDIGIDYLEKVEERYVIESVLHPGSFWDENLNQFRGWLFATKYSPYEGFKAAEAVKKAMKEEPCTITKVYGAV